jgi:hypothetical protein
LTLKEIQAEYELTPLDVLLFKRITKAWLTERRAHFINKHKFCDDVKKSMDELLEEL